MKNIIIVSALVLIGTLAYMFFGTTKEPTQVTKSEEVPSVTTGTTTQKPVVKTPEVIDKTKTVIGTSAGGNSITAYHYGSGDTELLFVGGIHGGYEWNTVLVAYELMDYLKANPSAIPSNIKVTVIPVLNPDGLSKVVGTTERFTKADVPSSEEVVISGRFNKNTVDLNRNFDCDWKAEGTWQTKTVSGGTEAFSEPESKAIKNYTEKNKLSGVVVWYSAAGGVFASNCHNGVSTATKAMTKTFADASGYPASQSFDFYATTGDMVNWLAKNNVPAISVLLTNHTDTEWSKNQKGVMALLKYYTK